MRLIVAFILAVIMMLPTSGADTNSSCAACEKVTVAIRKATPAATVVGGDSYFKDKTIAVIAGDTVTWTNKGELNHTVTSDNGLFDSGNMRPGQSFSVTFKLAGVYTYNCLYHRSDGMTGTVVVNDAVPVISSATTATGAVGQFFAYTIEASGNPLSYTALPLPPGLALSGNTIVGMPQQTGMFVINLNASNSTGAANVSLVVEILAGTPELDSDGDGFPDALETAVGSLPTDPASTPYSIAANVYTSLSVSKLSLKLDFTKPGHDQFSLKGTLPIPGNFAPENQQLGIDLGGVTRVFTLDSKGSAAFGRDTFKLSIKRSQAALPQNAPFTLKLSRAQLAQTFAANGLDASATLQNVHRALGLTVLFNGTNRRVTQALLYSSKLNKSGIGKQR